MRASRRFKPGTAELVDTSNDIDEALSIEMLAQSLGSLAEIRLPRDAEEPILAPRVRAAMLEWMTEIRAADELRRVKVTPRSTALLYGPPGCGKTTLAHHLAARLGMPLVVMEAAAVHTQYLGETGRNLLKFFTVLQAYPEPVVVLLDEIDGIGGKRNDGSQGSHAGAADLNHTVNTLLTQIERFQGLLLAATNRHDTLDTALWRRFGMQIAVELPGPDETFAILKRYSLPYQFDDGVIDCLVKLTKGAPPSLLRQLMEGIKRSLVLSPRLKRKIDDPVVVVETVAAAVAPHPDYDPPPLWRDKGYVQRLAGLPWPPALTPKEA